MNPYQILEISENASHNEIRKAYIKLALKWHPDKCRINKNNNKYDMKFKQVLQAYNSLVSDDYKKTNDDTTFDYSFDNGISIFNDYRSFYELGRSYRTSF